MSETHTDGPVLLGYRKGGRPIYLAQGGAEPPTFQQPPAPDPGAAGDPGAGDDPPAADPPEGDPADPADLGEAGKQAIERMKAKVKDETAKRKAAEAKAAALEAKNAAPPKPDDAPTAEQLLEQARTEARAEVAHDRALDRVEVLAAREFANPADARMFLAPNVEEFLDNGAIDSDAITEALADLLKNRPYLAAGTPRKWAGSGDGGVRGGKPKDLDSQIAEAQARGDVTAFVALQNQKLQPTT